jgi:hypothetical protein
MAAFVRWAYPHEASEEEKDSVMSSGPEGGNVELMNRMYGPLDFYREKYVKNDETYGEDIPLFPQVPGVGKYILTMLKSF